MRNNVARTTAGSETALAGAFKAALAKKEPTKQTKALEKAITKSQTKVERPPMRKRKIERHNFKKEVSWGNKDFGTLHINMGQFALGKEGEQGPFVWTRILKGTHAPRDLKLDFTAELGEDVVLLHAQGGVVTDVSAGTIPPLPVHVTWKEGARRDSDPVPHARRTDADNCDFVFLRRDGKFVQVQVSIVTRRGPFFVAVQEVWAGQVVRTTMDNAAQLETTIHTVQGMDGRDYGAFVAPLYDDNAYPGADYLKTFKNMGPKVVEYANVNGMTSPLSSAVVAEWTPATVEGLPEEMAAAGWKTGIVTFFNAVVNYGFIKCDEDGKDYFLYGDQIVGEDLETPVVRNADFPVVEAMKGVVFKVGPGKKPGTVQAVQVFQPKVES